MTMMMMTTMVMMMCRHVDTRMRCNDYDDHASYNEYQCDDDDAGTRGLDSMAMLLTMRRINNSIIIPTTNEEQQNDVDTNTITIGTQLFNLYKPTIC